MAVFSPGAPALVASATSQITTAPVLRASHRRFASATAASGVA